MLYRLFLLLIGATFNINAHIELVQEDTTDQAHQYFLSMVGAFEHISGQPQHAHQTYQELSSMLPNSPALAQAKIRLAFERARYEEVIAQESMINLTDPAHKEAAINLAQAYLFTHNTSKALSILAQLKKTYSRDDRLEYYMTLAHIKQGNFTQAHRVIDSVLSNEALESKHFLFRFLKAKMLLNDGDLTNAALHADKALGQNPRFAKAIILKGVIAEKRNQPEVALQTYEHYISMTSDPEITNKVITLCFRLGKFARAKKLLLTRPQNSADHYHDLALVCFKMGEQAEAHRALDSALKKNAHHAKAQDLKIEILLAERKLVEAAKLFRQWLCAAPHQTSLIRRWCLLAKKGMPHAITIDTLRVVAQRTCTFPLCFALGDLLHKHERYEEARTWYHKALTAEQCAEKSLNRSKIEFQIARTWYQEDQFTKASEALSRSLSCAPAYPSAHNLAALIMIKRGGDLSAAKKHVAAALNALPGHEPYLMTQKRLQAYRGELPGNHAPQPAL